MAIGTLAPSTAKVSSYQKFGRSLADAEWLKRVAACFKAAPVRLWLTPPAARAT
jgi:hypothetical protein